MDRVKRVAKKSTNFLGFKRGYNVILFIIFGGALVGFSIAKMEDTSMNGLICRLHGAAGECYYHKQRLYNIAITLHVVGVLPFAFLGTFQFVPIIRHKALLFHRLNGYVVILMFLLSNVGALILAPRAMGGALATQTIIGLLFLMTNFAILNAYYNVKRLQLDQHRAWMLRTFAWAGVVISMRLIVMCMARIISIMPSSYQYYDVRSCRELTIILGADPVYKFYPECIPGNTNSTNPGEIEVVLRATLNSDNLYSAVGVGDVTFPAALWLALAIHAIGMELYIAFTPKEAQRLRQVSYERQLARGFKNPGSAGLVLEKFADADPWVPAIEPLQERHSHASSLSTSDEESVNVEKRVSKIATATIEP